MHIAHSNMILNFFYELIIKIKFSIKMKLRALLVDLLENSTSNYGLNISPHPLIHVFCLPITAKAKQNDFCIPPESGSKNNSERKSEEKYTKCLARASKKPLYYGKKKYIISPLQRLSQVFVCSSAQYE